MRRCVPRKRERRPTLLRSIACATALCTAAAMSPRALAQAQSVLHPAGAHAEMIAAMWWVMAIGATVIFVMVIGLALYAVFATPAPRSPGAGLNFVRIGGFAFPVVVLTALLVYTLTIERSLTAPLGPNALRVEVVGNMWWWEVRYFPEGSERSIVAANEIHIPVGQPVEIVVKTNDVIHSFWIPRLAGKIDLIPGHTNMMRLQASESGMFRGQCAEYCGLQHAWMAFYVVAKPVEEFATWLENEARPAPEPVVPFLTAGRDAFLAAGCGACHTVRGTSADGKIGPDLTHVGSRVSIGAGVLGNGVGHLAGWIVDSQHIKPGNRMPSFNEFDGPTLRALAAWLASLK